MNQIFYEYMETIKVIDGDIVNLKYHQDRYEGVLKHLGSSSIEDLSTHIKAPKKGLYRCRLLYDKNQISVSYHEYQKREIKSLKLVYDEIDYSFKYSNRDNLDKLFSFKDGCDDILIVKSGLITDTSISNIAFYNKGVWITPKSPLLKGTTRARLLEEGTIIEADIRVEDLKSFSKVALLNAMIGFDILDKYEILI